MAVKVQWYKHDHVQKLILVIVSQLTRSKTSQVFMLPKIKIASTTITYLSAAVVSHDPCESVTQNGRDDKNGIRIFHNLKMHLPFETALFVSLNL